MAAPRKRRKTKARSRRAGRGRKTTARRAVGRKRNTGRRKARSKRWSAAVMRRSNALDLEQLVFKSRDPAWIARSLKRSAERSKRRKGTPYQSAMSMLNFYINRAGRSLPARDQRVLERTKTELRKVFGRDA
jgi:hypothetical protein